jgi:hypothetical protein
VESDLQGTLDTDTFHSTLRGISGGGCKITAQYVGQDRRQSKRSLRGYLYGVCAKDKEKQESSIEKQTIALWSI